MSSIFSLILLFSLDSYMYRYILCTPLSLLCNTFFSLYYFIEFLIKKLSSVINFLRFFLYVMTCIFQWVKLGSFVTFWGFFNFNDYCCSSFTLFVCKIQPHSRNFEEENCRALCVILNCRVFISMDKIGDSWCYSGRWRTCGSTLCTAWLP